MAIPRRLRFEVLRRDGHRCRYCGAGPEDAKLTADHVIPEALGGPTTLDNLVTACEPCNSGKASIPPDAVIVADMSARTLRWRDAIVQVAREDHVRWAQMNALESRVEFEWADKGKCRWCGRLGGDHLPDDARSSLEAWVAAGGTESDMIDLTNVTWRSRVSCDQMWRYFCGCMWTRIRGRQERALEIVESR